MNADYVRAEIKYRRERDGRPGLWLRGRIAPKRPTTVCAWCSTVMVEGDPERTSHGICQGCMNALELPEH